MSDIDLEGKSPAYIEGVQKARLEMAAKYGMAFPDKIRRPAVRHDARPPVISRNEFREDAARTFPAPTAGADSAARAKANMLHTDCHVRLDDALNRAGLVDHTERDRQTAETVAFLEARDRQYREAQDRKIAAAGQPVLRADAAYDRNSASAARGRMAVRQDRYAFEDPASRADEQRADEHPGASAADARARLYSRGS